MLRFKRQEKQRGRSRRGKRIATEATHDYSSIQFQRREVSGMERPWADEVNEVLKMSAGFRK